MQCFKNPLSRLAVFIAILGEIVFIAGMPELYCLGGTLFTASIPFVVVFVIPNLFVFVSVIVFASVFAFVMFLLPQWDIIHSIHPTRLAFVVLYVFVILYVHVL